MTTRSPPGRDHRSIDVVILSWNDGPLLQRAIDSVHRSEAVAARCVVVDNGSDQRPNAQLGAGDLLITLPHNVGVAAGRNNGAWRGTAPLVCFLDSDAVLHADTLRRLADVLDTHPRIALAAPVFDHQEPTDSGGLAPTFRRKLDRALGSTSAYAAGTEREGLIDVDFTIGACQLFRREAFEAVGGLDERYFYGPEDADFGMRLRLHGWRVVQVPGAGCEHPPRRRNRKILTRRGMRHAGAVIRFLWQHRRFHSEAPST